MVEQAGSLGTPEVVGPDHRFEASLGCVGECLNSSPPNPEPRVAHAREQEKQEQQLEAV